MDDSEVYRRMADHEKIQGGHEWKDGDVFWCADIARNLAKIKKAAPTIHIPEGMAFGIFCDGVVCCDGCNEEYDLYPFNKFFPADDVVWLPCMGRLIEMLPETGWSLNGWPETDHTAKQYRFRMKAREWVFPTPEQALIQGVMHQHNLYWEEGWKEK